MARRIYTRNSGSGSGVKQQAIRQLRETRARIREEHPGLLADLKQKIIASGLEGALKCGEVMSHKPEMPADDLLIDKKKNLETIMQFMAMSPRSPDFQSKIKAILVETKI